MNIKQTTKIKRYDKLELHLRKRKLTKQQTKNQYKLKDMYVSVSDPSPFGHLPDQHSNGASYHGARGMAPSSI